jgi:hypothetical protein
MVMAPGAWAQGTPWFDYTPLGEVRKYLQLTDTQYQAILDQNERYNRMAQEKVRRIAQVQVEIGEETDKSPLDPAALGIRYAEIEAICRELKDESDRARQQSLAALTEPQRTRLNALEEAIKLYPVIAEAEAGNLLPGPYAAANYASRSVGVGRTLGAALGGISACVQPRLQGLLGLMRDPVPVTPSRTSRPLSSR